MNIKNFDNNEDEIEPGDYLMKTDHGLYWRPKAVFESAGFEEVKDD